MYQTVASKLKYKFDFQELYKIFNGNSNKAILFNLYEISCITT